MVDFSTDVDQQQLRIDRPKSCGFVEVVCDVAQGFEYSRSGNPTRSCLEKCLAALENGKHGECFGVLCSGR